MRGKDYAPAAFFFAKGEGALPALMAAQRFLAASAMAFRPAALRVRFAVAGAGAETARANALLAGGRPRRFTVPCRARMAASIRSRSATSRATICSVCIIGL